eukprot:1309597-Rhodomonas_salina.1
MNLLAEFPAPLKTVERDRSRSSRPVVQCFCGAKSSNNFLATQFKFPRMLAGYAYGATNSQLSWYAEAPTFLVRITARQP